MITVRLNGRLGNQMFQYAAALSLAAKRQTTVGFDLSLLEEQGIPFSLSCFGITPVITPERSLPIRVRSESVLLRKSRSFYEKYLLNGDWTYFMPEGAYTFDRKFFECSNKCFLAGYFQSQQYFNDIADKVRSTFTVRAEPSERTKSLLERMARQKAVTVHVRRGDYVENEEYNKFFGFCGINYFLSAASIANDENHPNIWVFLSDDPAYVQRELAPAIQKKTQMKEYEVVSWTNESTAYEDLLLMTAAEVNIISNSTFSWWGAWLNANKRKRVFAPSRWVIGTEADDIVPREWTKISNLN